MSEDCAFQGFPKIARLSRGMVISEKIDGTNAQIFVHRIIDSEFCQPFIDGCIAISADFRGDFALFAGSRSRWLNVSKGGDNFGFAKWAEKNKDELIDGLGEGRHYGEWWGQGIQRGYGLTEKRFSLFNSGRWNAASPPPSCCHVAPVLHEGPFDTGAIDWIEQELKDEGSRAAPGFMQPEGIVIYHVAGHFLFKKTLDGDELPKSAANDNVAKHSYTAADLAIAHREAA